jgi:hypothetical protein
MVVPAGVLRTGQEKMTINVSGALRSEESLRAVTLRINDRYLPLTDTIEKERLNRLLRRFALTGVLPLVWRFPWRQREICCALARR